VKRSLGSLTLALLLPLVLVFGVLRPFVAEIFRIPSQSMSPTLRAGDRVMVAKSEVLFGSPRRTDLIAFRATKPERAVFVKRLVAIAGDTVAIWDGVLYVNRRPQNESYVNLGLNDSTFYGPERVPANHVFVLGDNRSNSIDSRVIGPVPVSDVLGRVLFRF
jgi:signal peptidase I